MIRLFAIGLLALTAVTAASTDARAQGILDIGRIILGLPTEQKEPIEYRERAPLVVPPSQNLRPPQESVPADQRRANWPQDPDINARRRAAEDARRPVSTDSAVGREPVLTRPLTPAEIRAGRVAGAEVPRTPTGPSIQPENRETQSFQNVFGGLAALRQMDQRDAANVGKQGELGRAEPPREFLTDPPTGLRRPADGAAFRATREGQVGIREDPKAYDIFREGPNTR